MKTKFNYLFVVGLLGFLLASPAFAEEALDDQEIINIEGVYSDVQSEQTQQVQQTQEAEKAANLPVELKADEQNAPPTPETVEVKELKDLSRLSPFSEVSVIQKKYLPKTERFQIFAAGSLMTNTPWYNNYGARLHFGYNFTENFGVEINSSFLTNTEREAAKEIRENNGLQTEQFIYTKNYVGLDIVWSPIYGKMTSLDNTITPFDMYFTFGGGTSNTNSQEKSNATFHVGTGQIFAITKAIAFRWDYSFNFFQATPVPTDDDMTPTKGSYNDLVLSAGLSFFFPEVSER